MPKISLSAAENLLRSFNPNMQRSSYKKLAKAGLKRIDAIEQEGVPLTEQEILEQFRTIVYTDPTGEEVAACVDGRKDCRNHQELHPFHPNAARRIQQKELIPA